MSKRKSISKTVRFEVFKRDNFSCQYCGAKSPDVVLHLDHIHPVSKGGDNEIINLVTACDSCNLGKSDVELNDNAAIAKQRAQLEVLNERREQLEMLLEWRESLKDFDQFEVDAVIEAIESNMGAYSVNETGAKSVAKWIKRFSVSEVLQAIDKAAEKITSTEPDSEEVESYFDSIPKICSYSKMPESEQRLLYARGIIRKRLRYINEKKAIALLRGAFDAGIEAEELVEFARNVENWVEFREKLEEIING